MKYLIPNVKVKRVFEHKYRRWISGAGSDAVFEPVSQGWFVLLEGSHEALHVGHDKPALKVGDIVNITIQKPIQYKAQEPDAQPRQDQVL